MKAKLTKEQKAALNNYNYEVKQADRYLGSVFVTPTGQKRAETKVADAYAQCKSLGMDHTHGL